MERDELEINHSTACLHDNHRPIDLELITPASQLLINFIFRRCTAYLEMHNYKMLLDVYPCCL